MSSDEQVQRVEEALKRLPRPAILYVTEVQEAVKWGVRLQEAGFARSRAFHGSTSAADRKAIDHRPLPEDPNRANLPLWLKNSCA